jgi:Xaa-Pro aminopeptidase
MWDSFSAAEMERRHALARDLMDEHALEALVLFGNSGVNRHNQANVFWLSNHLDLHHCYLVLPREGEAALFVGLANHVPNAREASDVPVIEWGGYRPAEKVAERLGGAGRVGLVGVNATFAMGMPYGHWQELDRRVPELVDVTREFQGLRLVKSEEEIDWLRRAAELSDLAMLAVGDGARPGMTEFELVALAEDAYRRLGGQAHITFLRSMPMDAPTGCLPAQNPSARGLERGDVIITEFSASYWGYSGQLHRPVFLGAEPSPEWQRLFDVALAAYEGLAAAVRAGAHEADAIAAAAVIPDAGYAIYDDLLHGYGVDILPPLIDRTRLQPSHKRSIDHDGVRFEEGMAVVLQPNPVTRDERMGLQLGALTIVRADGAECLHHVPFEPLIAEA